MANSIILTEKSQLTERSFYSNNRFVGFFNISNMGNSAVGDAFAILEGVAGFEFIEDLRLRSVTGEMPDHHPDIMPVYLHTFAGCTSFDDYDLNLMLDDTVALSEALDRLTGYIVEVKKGLGARVTDLTEFIKFVDAHISDDYPAISFYPPKEEDDTDLPEFPSQTICSYHSQEEATDIPEFLRRGTKS